MLRGISVPGTTDSLYVGAPVTQFTRTPALYIQIIPIRRVTELNFVNLSAIHLRKQDHVKPHNKGVSVGRNNRIIYA